MNNINLPDNAGSPQSNQLGWTDHWVDPSYLNVSKMERYLLNIPHKYFLVRCFETYLKQIQLVVINKSESKISFIKKIEFAMKSA